MGTGRKNMKSAIIIIAVLAIAAMAQTETSSLRVEEVFSVETAEELEASLTDGYPMPWLAEILEDETIPEEDRYWLDCRVRAVIAQDLHLFFDEEGNPVHIEADWIKPSENYWRESFLITSPSRESNEYQVDFGGSFDGRPGIIVGSHGDRIGEVSISGLLLSGSKDGSLFATSINQISGYGYRLILLYSDGSYFVSPIEMGYGRCGVSQSADYVILAARGKRNLWNREDILPRAILLNRSGEIIWETELEMTPIGNPTPVISPDDRYCAVVTQASSAEDRLNLLLQVFDMETGREVWRLEDPTGTRIHFSPDSKTLFIPGNVSEASAFNTENGDRIWTDQRVSSDALTYVDLRELNGSNNADFLSAVIHPAERTAEFFLALFSNSGRVLAIDTIDGGMDISPNGCIVISENYRPNSSRSVIPLIIRRILKDGE
ncbi:MAG: PQQ-binding-like beta-propeller repeat protein [Candidatus Aegiribacteria sp.]|nr:PQQ-binding-like beta-propeller repeat protein [Candidatus Aegiribacteria sp.]